MARFATNERAKYDYELLETYSAGIELMGHEVKSVRQGQCVLRGAYVTVRGGEAFLIGCDIPPYQAKNTPEDYDPRRVRKLLLSKKEVVELARAEETATLTIVPLSVYNKGRFLKVDIAVARGKKKFDKRQTIKKRDTDREIRRTL
jgi:SsrA-binding protein